jgi:hypothetical protein
MRTTFPRALVAVAFMLAVAGASRGQVETRPSNESLLKAYAKEHALTELEYRLILFNLAWVETYDPATHYVKAAPVQYREGRHDFTCGLTVVEKRTPTDPEPFSKLAEPRRRAVLEDTHAYLVQLLARTFPEVVAHPQLLLVEFFTYPEDAEVPRLVAVVRDGRLQWAK